MTKRLDRPPTKAQRHVLDLMRSGWQLGQSGGIDPRAWMQEGGLGRGGPSEAVHIRTLIGLHQRGLIEASGPAPGLGRAYRLVERKEDEL